MAGWGPPGPQQVQRRDGEGPACAGGGRIAAALGYDHEEGWPFPAGPSLAAGFWAAFGFGAEGGSDFNPPAPRGSLSLADPAHRCAENCPAEADTDAAC